MKNVSALFRPIGMIHDSHSSGHFGNLWNKSQKNRLEPLSSSSGPVSNPICACMTSNTCTCRIKTKRKLAQSDQWTWINILHLAQIRSNRCILQSFLQTMRCCSMCHRPLLQALQRRPPLVSSSLPRGQWPRANTSIVMYCPYIAHMNPSDTISPECARVRLPSQECCWRSDVFVCPVHLREPLRIEDFELWLWIWICPWL